MDAALGPIEGNLRAIDTNKEPCPHLRGETPGEYSCAIHDKIWYKDTPCHSHGQIERSPNDLCRIGNHIINKKGKTVAVAHSQQGYDKSVDKPFQ